MTAHDRHAAASYGHTELLEALLGAGADVNIRDIDGDAPLHFCEVPEAAELLLLAGAELNAINDAGETVLDRAMTEDNETMVVFWVNFHLLSDVFCDTNPCFEYRCRAELQVWESNLRSVVSTKTGFQVMMTLKMTKILTIRLLYLGIYCLYRNTYQL